ncbi:Gamma-glutamylputrescine oxidoreductase [Pseudogemmobacter humi]|uniref:Gamma-glutamylputrescine oxidoreductase n=2 Tax=Pseudogemmobacter humi TaxID=2483812 RepID=A0A3P5XRU1_9RHOB|nr:Gamma-glutamylputrescine oxidoreductase [Pseudogemmobacter humi]
MTGARPYDESLWRKEARTPAFAAPPFAAGQADVAIVGGGFTGLSAALHLAELGREVVLLEAADIGFGASGRNGGQVNPGLKYDLPALEAKFGTEAGSAFWRMGQEAPDFLAAMIRRLNLDCDLEENGLLRLAHNKAAMAAMWKAADALEAGGLPVRRLADRRAVEAETGTARYEAGFVDPRGRSVRPQDLASELARAAARAGVRIHCQSPVIRLNQNGKGWEVATAQGVIRAREVIVATNGYTDGLVPGLAPSLLPVNSFQIATARLDEDLSRRILPGRQTVYDSRRLILYFRKTSDNRVMIGGRASFSSSRKAGGRSPDYSRIERVLHGIFPQLAGLPVEMRWAGLVCITRDFLPHYHVPAPGLHVVTGYNGRGVALANRAGAWIARHLCQAPDTVAMPVVPITPVPFHRWREPLLNIAMKGQYLLDLAGR